jgi:hypothetical protein
VTYCEARKSGVAQIGQDCENVHVWVTEIAPAVPG